MHEAREHEGEIVEVLVPEIVLEVLVVKEVLVVVVEVQEDGAVQDDSTIPFHCQQESHSACVHHPK